MFFLRPASLRLVSSTGFDSILFPPLLFFFPSVAPVPQVSISFCFGAPLRGRSPLAEGMLYSPPTSSGSIKVGRLLAFQ